jgi:hypothetical protein
LTSNPEREHQVNQTIDIKVSNTEPATCACGCGERRGTKSNFRPGHDQRLMGILLDAHRSDQDVTVTNGSTARTMSPAKYAAEVFSEKGLAKYERREANPPKRARGTSAAQAADVIASAPVEPELEAVKAQIGRWTYPAVVTDRDQDGKPFEVRYQDKKGKSHITTKFQLVD